MATIATNKVPVQGFEGIAKTAWVLYTFKMMVCHEF